MTVRDNATQELFIPLLYYYLLLLLLSITETKSLTNASSEKEGL